MTPEFHRQSGTDWETRYVQGDMPWEKGEASPGLVDFLKYRRELPRGRVLVPGCGTGHDVRAWAKRSGMSVTGVDLAPSAIRMAREWTREAALHAEFHEEDFLVRAHDSGPPPASGTGFDWIFEHTLFCAIQPERRPEYVDAVRKSLKPGGYFLAVYYLIDDKEGPPFGTTRQEIVQRFTPQFSLLESWTPRSYPNRTGLEWMVWWRVK